METGNGDSDQTIVGPRRLPCQRLLTVFNLPDPGMTCITGKVHRSPPPWTGRFDDFRRLLGEGDLRLSTSVVAFEVAILPVALVFSNPLRKRGMSQYQ
ncbi:hypothetical protein Pla100_26210 [Neorhodopirellula pilleata]|uniref:Uncharacterized protein n=1 Tax=Neorhodopirellula pilleata TaxID=2714738 RepID=A0A5C6ADI1_9BACT|nr:hypothetical protein Pla100_26210 [Neorhodopirellula pilleata]